MENKDVSIKSVATDIGGIIAAVVFFASFAPYFMLIYFGIDGINFGMQGIVRAYGIAGIIIGVYTNSEAIAEIINHRCLRILLMNALAV